jgi:hypothetical protein
MKNGLYVERDMQIYYKNNKFHREDGPAVIFNNGRQEWWIEGKRHRINEPAVISADGRQEWYFEGKLHRIDGPARLWVNGNHEWWKEGNYLGYDEHGFWMLWNRLTTNEQENLTLLKFLPGLSK